MRIKFKPQTITVISIAFAMLSLFFAYTVWAGTGTTDSSAAPGATNSYTLEDIYNSLNDGTAGTQSTFTEPGVAPGTGTMHTLNDIYNLTRERAPLPKTGQANCFDAGGTEISCTGTGQDGELQKGVAWPNPRFTDNGDGTVTDNLTRLIWLKNANCPSALRQWSTALSDVTQLNTNGTMNSNACGDTSNGGSHQTDWRLPNVRELYSLVDFSQTTPALPSVNPFTGVESNVYWTSTSLAFNKEYAWYLHLSYGELDIGTNNKLNFSYVWPVRAGQ